MSQRGTSCANLYAAAVQHDKVKAGFTLAEVLITLTIIGVIAALTIPNLMQKYTEQTTVKKVQKFYSNLSNAYSLAIKENGPANEWGLTGYNSESAEKIYELLFKPYFKIAKNCGVDNTGNCVKSGSYKALNNNIDASSGNYGTNTRTYKLSPDDGSTVVFYYTDNFIVIIYDANGGKNAPNEWGKDTFGFFSSITSNRLAPFGLQDKQSLSMYPLYPSDLYCKADGTDFRAGTGCAAWVVYKGNMDYLHCNDLSWNGKNKCK